MDASMFLSPIAEEKTFTNSEQQWYILVQGTRAPLFRRRPQAKVWLRSAVSKWNVTEVYKCGETSNDIIFDSRSELGQAYLHDDNINMGDVISQINW